jgi:hypothetical protein
MPLAELRLRPGPDDHDQQFGFLCSFCRGEQENGCIGFNNTLDDPDAPAVALQMLMEHYMEWHPGLLKEVP